MTSTEPQRTTDDEAAATAPLIVNGLTVRPRQKVQPVALRNSFAAGFCGAPRHRRSRHASAVAVSRRQRKAVHAIKYAENLAHGNAIRISKPTPPIPRPEELLAEVQPRDGGKVVVGASAPFTRRLETPPTARRAAPWSAL